MLLFFLAQVELLSGGVNMPVTPLNVYEYVRKYAEHRMLVVAEQPLHVSKTIKYLLAPWLDCINNQICIPCCACLFLIGDEEGFTGCTP